MSSEGDVQENHLREAVKVSVDHSERDAHRFMKRSDLVLPVPISYLTVPAG